MAHMIIDHGVSGCFGIRLAPKRRNRRSIEPSSSATVWPQHTMSFNLLEQGRSGKGVTVPQQVN